MVCCLCWSNDSCTRLASYVCLLLYSSYICTCTYMFLSFFYNEGTLVYMADRAYGTSLSLFHVILGKAMLLFDCFDSPQWEHSSSISKLCFTHSGNRKYFLIKFCLLLLLSLLFSKLAPCCADPCTYFFYCNIFCGT